MKRTASFILCMFFVQLAYSQEFPKGWAMYAEYFNGFSTKFNAAPELFLTELRFTPQYTLVPGAVRIGLPVGFQYNNRQGSGLAGVDVSINIHSVTIQNPIPSTIGDVQLVVENLYGTNQQQMIGGGIRAEIGQKLLLSITGDRDYHLNNWRFQFGIGYNFTKYRVPPITNL